MDKDSVIHTDDGKIFYEGTTLEVVYFLQMLNPVLYKFVRVISKDSPDSKVTVREYLLRNKMEI
jgi:hypothetical protein